MLDCRSEESSGNIYEKYNCTGAGRPGGGGEYDVQVIFNWVGHMMSNLARQSHQNYLLICTAIIIINKIIIPVKDVNCRKVLDGPMGWLSVFLQGELPLWT